jgi:hypothetical protein
VTRDPRPIVKPAPAEIHGGRVIRWSWIDGRHRATGACRHIVGSEVQGPAAALAICQFEGEKTYFLFGCNADWKVVTDSWNETLELALAQAEFEYERVSATWSTV